MGITESGLMSTVTSLYFIYSLWRISSNEFILPIPSVNRHYPIVFLVFCISYLASSISYLCIYVSLYSLASGGSVYSVFGILASVPYLYTKMNADDPVMTLSLIHIH